jgi:hypothetical protein
MQRDQQQCAAKHPAAAPAAAVAAVPAAAAACPLQQPVNPVAQGTDLHGAAVQAAGGHSAVGADDSAAAAAVGSPQAASHSVCCFATHQLAAALVVPTKQTHYRAAMHLDTDAAWPYANAGWVGSAPTAVADASAAATGMSPLAASSLEISNTS